MGYAYHPQITSQGKLSLNSVSTPRGPSLLVRRYSLRFWCANSEPKLSSQRAATDTTTTLAYASANHC
jgi:hypothetical protein